MPLLSLDAACCAAYLTISAKKPSPDAKCGVVFSFMRESGHGEDKTELIVRKIMSGSLLEAAGLKVGDRVMDLCNQKPRSAQEAASLLRNAESTIEMTIERNSTKVTHIADLNPLQEVAIAKLVANEALDMDLDPSKEDEKLSGSYYLGGRKVEGLDVGDLIVCMGKTRRIRLNAALHPAARFPSPALALTTDLFFPGRMHCRCQMVCRRRVQIPVGTSLPRRRWATSKSWWRRRVSPAESEVLRFRIRPKTLSASSRTCSWFSPLSALWSAARAQRTHNYCLPLQEAFVGTIQCHGVA